MGYKEGSYCPNCGLANWEGLCPHCSGEEIEIGKTVLYFEGEEYEMTEEDFSE